MRFLALSVFVAAGCLAAQEFRATITGRVTDSSGAAIAGAKVTVKNTATNVATHAVTTETGNYVAAFLPPGRYRIEFEHPGFRQFAQDGVVLQVGDRRTVDVMLEVGDVSTSITVSGDASLLETATASRGDVLTARTITDMPLNGRNVFMLATLTAGVTFTARGPVNAFIRTTSNGGMSALSIAGGQPGFNEALLDGVSNAGSDGVIQFVPSVEATQEFKVQANSFDAEYGRFTGGLINATTKSGTNEVHGVFYEFVRNSAFNARDTFAVSKPQFGYNLFGASVGGPVYLPKLYNGRNRTFFFFNYEGSREGVPRAAVLTVPTAGQKRGDFAQTFVRVGNQPTAVTVFDPATTRLAGASYVRDPFPGNRIPSARFEPIAMKALEFYPEPNAPGDAVTGGSNWQADYKDAVLDNGYIVRIDHGFGDNHRVFGRYSWRHFRQRRNPNYYPWYTTTLNDRYAPGVAFDDTYTVNPTTVLNWRYGFSRLFENNRANLLGYDIGKMGFPASFISQLDVLCVPVMNISGYATISRPPLQRTAEDTHTLRGGLMKIMGRQSLRVGAEFRVLRSNDAGAASDGAGSFTFNNGFTRGPNPQAATVTAGSGLASFLLGLPASGSASRNAKPADQGTYYGLYVQDDFRVSRRLTLNLGLRYEWEGAYTERYNRLNRGFDSSTESPISGAARANYARAPISEVPAAQFRVLGGLLFANAGGQPRGLTNWDGNNLAPRIGAAYAAGTKTVLRAGYGAFFGATTRLAEPRHGFSIQTPFIGSIDGGLTPYHRLSNPFPDGLLSPHGAALGLMTMVGQSISYVHPDLQQPLAHQYQFSVQRVLPGALLLEAAYSGSLIRHRVIGRQMNSIPDQYRAAARAAFLATGRNVLNDSVPNPFLELIATGPLAARTVTRGQLLRPHPQFVEISDLGHSVGRGRYDSVQFKATKRLSHGLSLLASYVVSKQLISGYMNETDSEQTQWLAGFDTPQRLVVSGTYELPFGPGKRLFSGVRGFPARLVEGFQANVVYTAHRGIPVSVSGAESIGRSARLQNPTLQRWFDTSAFRVRETLELAATGTLPDVRSHGRNNFDISVFKTTTIHEKLKLQFRAESFNSLNHPEFAEPNGAFGSPTFGRVTASNKRSRELQFGVRLVW